MLNHTARSFRRLFTIDGLAPGYAYKPPRHQLRNVTPSMYSENPARAHNRPFVSSASSSHAPPPPPPRKANLAFFAVPITITAALGTWQVARLFSKREQIADRAARLAEPECALADLAVEGGKWEERARFRRVTVRGDAVVGEEALIGPRSAPKGTSDAVKKQYGASGFYLLVPVKTTEGGVVWFNKGWVPYGMEDCQQYIEKETKTYSGIVTFSEKPNRFTPRNDPEKSEWFWVDLPAMVKHYTQRYGSIAPSAPPPCVVEEVVPPAKSMREALEREGLFPIPKSEDDFLQFHTMPSTHVTYAATWYTLALCLVLYYRSSLRRQAKKLSQQVLH